MTRSRGFTLIELMIAVAIIAILAAIAIPSYTDYIRRGRLTEALGRLSAMRVKMEQYFQDNRVYTGAVPATDTIAPLLQPTRRTSSTVQSGAGGAPRYTDRRDRDRRRWPASSIRSTRLTIS